MAAKQVDLEFCSLSDREEWLALRAALWPDLSAEAHRQEIDRISEHKARFAVFLCRGDSGPALGFAEASLRTDYVNGCGAGPVAFIEGIYVRSEHRRQGAARALCAAVESWARDQGCRELASDVELSNFVSQKVHVALGFTETERVVFYRKPL